ncbi:MAG: DUF805 domain-containing protein [Pseudomonadota bacterium]
MEWMLMPLRRYADFSGRSRRKEYWMFQLGYAILILVLVGLAGATGGFDESGSSGVGLIFLGLMGIAVLGLLIPQIAVQVRRFHDQDKSGWFILLGFIPYVGGLIVLVFMCLDGTRGANRFGPDPKGGVDPDVFE